MIENYWLMS